MITPDFVVTMARYNGWQNESLFAAANGLDDGARRADRGAFFGSIHRTLSHLLWADSLWMSRLDGWERPEVGIPGSGDWVEDWEVLTAERVGADDRIRHWSKRLDGQALEGDLAWYSGALGRDVARPRALCVVHFFNHQTHHRGQVHALLTSAGATPDATDLFAMPAMG